MIRTKREYEAAQRDLERSREEIKKVRASLDSTGLDEAGVGRVMGQMIAMQSQTESEIAAYKRARAGYVDSVSLANLGHLLINQRIASGLSQRELADRLGVTESVVSRDERHEYAGVTVDRAVRVLEALGVNPHGVQVTAPSLPSNAGGLRANSGATANTLDVQSLVSFTSIDSVRFQPDWPSTITSRFISTAPEPAQAAGSNSRQPKISPATQYPAAA